MIIILDVNKEIKRYLLNEINTYNFKLIDIKQETGLPMQICMQAISVNDDSFVTTDTFAKFQKYFDKHKKGS